MFEVDKDITTRLVRLLIKQDKQERQYEGSILSVSDEGFLSSNNLNDPRVTTPEVRKEQ